MDRPLAPETLAAQALGHVDPTTRALIPPIHMSTTFERGPDNALVDARGYARADSPAFEEPERLLAALEGGAGSLLFSSGMAAATSIFCTLVPGDHVLVPRVVYWGVRKWLAEFAVTWGIDVEYVDTADLAALAGALRPGQTRLVWVETPANPTWDITDIAAVCAIAHEAHARVVVDSTVATPVLTRPLALGADLVMHSATKALNGHSDVLAGAVVFPADDAFVQRLRAWRRSAGNVPGPMEAWLLLRGMRTLYLRVRHSCATALALAEHLDGHRSVSAVLYPGLASHPGHAVATRQMDGGFGTMLSLRLHGGEAAALEVVSRLRLVKRATSLGGTETLVEHRKTVEGPSSPVPADLLRISVGLEAFEDLAVDLTRALDAVARSGHRGDRPASAVGVPPPAPAAGGPEELVSLVDGSLRPTAIARGGGLHFVDRQGATVRLDATGSPGAVAPMRTSIVDQVRRHDPSVESVTVMPFDAPTGARGDAPAHTETLAARIADFLDVAVNPAISAHGGRVGVASVTPEGVVMIRFDGGCQGCTLSEVTLRQGVEPLLRERFGAELTAVVDLTDHTAGRAPYFTAAKR
jgi:cystathionine gamma-synthase